MSVNKDRSLIFKWPTPITIKLTNIIWVFQMHKKVNHQKWVKEIKLPFKAWADLKHLLNTSHYIIPWVFILWDQLRYRNMQPQICKLWVAINECLQQSPQERSPLVSFPIQLRMSSDQSHLSVKGTDDWTDNVLSHEITERSERLPFTHLNVNELRPECNWYTICKG